MIELTVLNIIIIIESYLTTILVVVNWEYGGPLPFKFIFKYKKSYLNIFISPKKHISHMQWTAKVLNDNYIYLSVLSYKLIGISKYDESNS